MKNVIWIAITIISWLVVAMLFEYDYRQHSGFVLSIFSPLQWFLFSIIIWGLTSITNVYILLVKKKLDYSLTSMWLIADRRELILCIVPVTNGYILIANILFLLRDIMLPDEKPMTAQQEFEEELKKNTIQSK